MGGSRGEAQLAVHLSAALTASSSSSHRLSSKYIAHCTYHSHLVPTSWPPACSLLQELLSFLLGPEARDLRPLLLAEVTNGLDLLLRDRLRRAAANVATLTPRLPFLQLPLPLPPPPPVPVPGRGLMPAQQLIDQLAPPLSQPEEVYLRTLVELAAGLLGVQPAELEAPDASLLTKLLLSPNEQVGLMQWEDCMGVLAVRAAGWKCVAELHGPGSRASAHTWWRVQQQHLLRCRLHLDVISASAAREKQHVKSGTAIATLLARQALICCVQVRELQQALGILLGGSSGTDSSTNNGSSGGGGAADPAVVRQMSLQVVDALMGRAAERLGVDVDTLFPMRRSLISALQQ